MKLRIITIFTFLFATLVFADNILIFMDENQTDHLRAYGVAYWCLQRGYEVEWLLNYRGGSFLTPARPDIEKICKTRGVAYTIVSNTEVAQIYN
ncbi:asparagine synthetase B, partial [bacterium]